MPLHVGDDGNPKKFYLHYFFPPSSVGETGRMGPANRREIGHGNLAERALGGAVQVEPIKPMLKVCDTTCLKLNIMNCLKFLPSISTCAATASAMHPHQRRLPIHSSAGEHHHGKAVQVDPMKATVQAPGSKRMRLTCHKSLSSFAFTFKFCFQFQLAPLRHGEQRIKLHGNGVRRMHSAAGRRCAHYQKGGGHRHGAHPGRQLQVDPIKPVLKPPRTQRLKLKYGKLLLSFAFKSNLRRYILGSGIGNGTADDKPIILTDILGRGLHSSTFRLNMSTFCWIKGILRGC